MGRSAPTKMYIDLGLKPSPEILTMVEKKAEVVKRLLLLKAVPKQKTNTWAKNYNSTKESSYITYVDANNLHGWAMVQALP